MAETEMVGDTNVELCEWPNIALDSSKYSLFPAVGHIKFIYMHIYTSRLIP